MEKIKIGELVERTDRRNSTGEVDNLIGVSIEKCFIKSVANTIGTDLTKYKIVEKDDFAVSLMQVSRDAKIPIARLDEYEVAIMSPAYSIFRIKDRNVILPEYLDMWFKREEFDREAAYIAVGGVRGSMPWEDFANIQVNVPDIDTQKKLIKSYNAVKNRIVLKQKINDNLVDTLQTMYKHLFIEPDIEYRQRLLSEICSKIGSGATPKGGKAAYCEEGISLIRSTNVFDFTFSYTDLAHISDSQADALSNVTVEANDVLFNITGVSVARCCMVPNNVLPARVNQHVMIIRPFAGKYMSYYLMAALCSTEYKSRLLGIGQSGSTREAINKQEIESFVLPIPPIDDITSFGKQADMLYNQIEANTNEVQHLEEVQHILLSRLSSR